MKRPYLRVTPGEEPVIPSDIPETVASLSKLIPSDSESPLRRLNLFHRQTPIRFEFVALCAGENEPVEFYYGADDHLDALEQRLRSIYPPTYDIDRVEIDAVKRLVRPVEYSREEFAERLEDSRLYYEMEPSADGRAAISNGGEVAVASDSTDGETELSERAESPEDDAAALDDIDLAAPRAADDDERLTALDRPTETADGDILARPPLAEVEPYGVEWWGAAARRKDWMTTLTGFTEVLRQDRRTADGITNQSRLPLEPLITALANAEHPLTFQVIFQRRADWSRDARRRTGELLAGTDTLLQRVLTLESPGARRQSSSRQNPNGATRRTSHTSSRRRTHSSTGDRPSRPTSVQAASRYDQVRENSPKRTFSVNLQLLTLAVADDEPAELSATLDPLRSVFDLVDGRFYELDGRRLRSQGYLPGSGRRHARAVLDRFTSRSVATGGRRVTITNRRETRPDLVLNGNELANFLIIPPSSAMSGAPDQQVVEPAADAAPTAESGRDEADIDPGQFPGNVETEAHGETPFSAVPETVVHRDDEIEQLADVLEPLGRGERTETALITGPTGSGKTCLATYAVDQFRQAHPAIEAVYVNCWADHSRFRVLYRLLDQLWSTVDIHRRSTPRDVLLERLRNLDDHPSVVILDEVDQLDDKGLLYDLLTLPQFTLLLIAKEEADLFDGLDERLASRLRGCERIRCTPYSEEQLRAILTCWSEHELDAITIDSSERSRIATAAGGDARVALTTLRIAARRTDQASNDRITQETIKRALPEARQEVRPEVIEELTPHQQTVFRVVRDHGRITPSELYEEYQDRVADPKTDRTVRNYLHELERYDLVAADGASRDRVYRCIASGTGPANGSP